MNSNLTYNELRDHLDRYNTDPLVRRLLMYINDKEENIIEGLIDIGMDEDGRIEGDDGWYLPGPYIRKLRQDASYFEDEAHSWEEKYEDMKDERNRLKARSVAELMQEMEERIRRAEVNAREADRVATQLQQKNEDLEEKINVWSILEK